MMLKKLLPAFILIFLSACGGLNEGNRVESITIVDSSSLPLRLDDCIGRQLGAIATFTDGFLFPFTNRVTWSVVAGGDQVDINATGFLTVKAGATADTITVRAQLADLIEDFDIELISDPLQALNFTISPVNPTLAPGTAVAFSLFGILDSGILFEVPRAIPPTDAEFTALIEAAGATTTSVKATLGSVATIDGRVLPQITFDPTSEAGSFELTLKICEDPLNVGDSNSATTTVAVAEFASVNIELFAENGIVQTPANTIGLNTTAVIRSSGVFGDTSNTQLNLNGSGLQSLEAINPPDPLLINIVGDLIVASVTGSQDIKGVFDEDLTDDTNTPVDSNTLGLTVANVTFTSNQLRISPSAPLVLADNDPLRLVPGFSVSLDLIGDTGDGMLRQNLITGTSCSIDNDDDVTAELRFADGGSCIGGFTAVSLDADATIAGAGTLTFTPYAADLTNTVSIPYTIVDADVTNIEIIENADNLCIPTVNVSDQTSCLRAIGTFTPTAGGSTFKLDITGNVVWETLDRAAAIVENSDGSAGITTIIDRTTLDGNDPDIRVTLRIDVDPENDAAADVNIAGSGDGDVDNDFRTATYNYPATPP